MGDSLSMADMERAKAMLERQRVLNEPLRYFATQTEVNNRAWRRWFRENFPGVELWVQRPVGAGPVIILESASDV